MCYCKLYINTALAEGDLVQDIIPGHRDVTVGFTELLHWEGILNNILSIAQIFEFSGACGKERQPIQPSSSFKQSKNIDQKTRAPTHKKDL